MAAPYRPFSGYIPYGQVVNNKLAGAGTTFDPLSNDIDLVWAGGKDSNEKSFSNYYDYYFAGEDVKVYIDGLFDPKDELDIQGLAFAIEQQKTPLYGFWSYNFDAMMLGTRGVAGVISVFTRYPRRMTDLLEKAAQVRVNSASSKTNVGSVVSSLRSQTESSIDEENVSKYWGYSQLDRVTTSAVNPALADNVQGGYANGDHNIFSAHPPFNLVIMYGVQDSSLTTIAATDNSSSADIERMNNLDRMMVTDINQRTVKLSTKQNPMKIIIQNVHLTKMSTNYQAAGGALVEQYSFMARDYYFSNANIRNGSDRANVTTVPNTTNTVPANNVGEEVQNPMVNINFQGLGTL